MTVDVLRLIEEASKAVPVPVFDLIQKAGIDLAFLPLDDDISGWIERREDGGYEIVVNENHSLSRRRFTAAHELGHYIYHRDLMGNGTGDTRAYRADQSPKPNAAIRPRHERQANTFAANLLMPKSTVEAALEGGVTDVAALADMFSVSSDAMRIRLGR